MGDITQDGPKPKKQLPVTGIDYSNAFVKPGSAQNIGGNNAVLGKPVIGDTGDSKYDNAQSFVDPNQVDVVHTDPTEAYEDKLKQIQYNRADQQSNLDKWGNGMVKFAGSFANGVLSTVGTIYGIAASPFTLIAGENSKIWDNAFSRLGDDISTSINESFRNYGTKKEENASAWSPDYWLTTNFISDNILGNLGYAAAGWATGVGMSKVLSRLAPFIASSKLETGLEIFAKSGIEGLNKNLKAGQALLNWDKAKQAISIGISASGEASTEAIQVYRESQKALTDKAIEKYGAKELIPDSVLQSIESDSRSAGNQTYAMNLPIIAGADVIQFGRSLSPFRSELKAFEKNPLRLTQTRLLEDYAAEAVEKTSRFKPGKIISALRSNIAEAGQEGAQYITSEGNKSWYQRKNDVTGWQGTNDMLDGYLTAAHDLFTTKEGVSNLLGGFAGGSPFAVSQYIQDKIKRPAEKEGVQQAQLDYLNKAGSDLKQNMKVYLDNMARHNSAQADLNQALDRGDEHGARNAKNDVVKSFINSRIRTGRADLLNNELEQIRAMNEDEFKSFFNIDETVPIDKDAVIDKFADTANEMLNTYRRMDRLFTPDMYKLGKLSPEDKEKKLGELQEYKEMVWNYMMDYHDREKRIQTLDKEVNEAFAGVMQFKPLMDDKFGNRHNINDLYRQYVGVKLDQTIKKRMDPNYAGTDEDTQLSALGTRIKQKMEEAANGKLAQFITVDQVMADGKKDYLEIYLYNVHKHIKPLLDQEIVQAALAKSDIHNTIRKMHDMVKLHTERRLAIHSYNQLASMIKNGTYLAEYMANPAYNEDKHKGQQEFLPDGKPNPEYVPERIPTDAMLQYDGYAKNKSEINNFYEDMRAKDEKNRAEAQQFSENLDASINEDITDESKAFHDRAKAYRYGSKTIKTPYRTLSDDQLDEQHKLIEAQIEANMRNGKWDHQTKKSRDNFDQQGFLDLYAQEKAARDEINERNKLRAEAINKEAVKIVDYYLANPGKVTVDDLVPGFRIRRKAFPDEVVERAREIITGIEERKAAELAAKQQEQQGPSKTLDLSQFENKDFILSDEKIERLKNNTLSAADVSTIADALANKIAEGGGYESLSENEQLFVQQYTAKVNEALSRKGEKALTERDLNPSLSQVEPTVFMMDNQSAMIEEGLVAAQNEVFNQREVLVEGPSFLRVRRSDLESRNKQNEYDSDGNVMIRNLNMQLFSDPLTNPLNLNNNPMVRLRGTGNKSYHGETQAVIEVSADGTTWTDTGWELQGLLDRDGKPIELDFNTEEKRIINNDERVAQQKAYIKGLQARLAEKDSTVDMVVRNEPSYGRLITNREDEDGERERKGLLDVAVDINNPNNPNSVHLAVLTTDSSMNAVAAYKDPLSVNANLTDIRRKPGIVVRQSLLNKISLPNKSGNIQRAGQYVMLLPTGKKEGSSQEYFPVLLGGRLLSAHQSEVYDIGSGENKGTPVNIGEILIDVLLNPYKEEYAYLWPGLFKMAGLAESDYKGIDHPETKWKDFYTTTNVNNIINQVFFSSAASVINISPTTYTNPFNFEIDETNDGSIRAHISIADKLLADRQSVKVYIGSKSGKLNKPIAGQEADYTQARINEYYNEIKKDVPQSKQLSYEAIQDRIKNKAFHVQIAKMSEPLATAPAYTGFVLDDQGKLKIETFNNYFEYVDRLGLAQSTIQAVKDSKGNAQYFVNQTVYLQEKQVPKDVLAGDAVLGSNVSPIEKSVTAPEVTDDANSTPTPAAGFTTTIAAANKRTSNRLAGGKNKNKQKGNDATSPMLEIKSIKQRSLAGIDAATQHYQNLIVSEVSTELLNILLKRNTKAPIRIKSGRKGIGLKEELLQSLNNRMYEIMKVGRPELAKISYSEWDVLPEEDANYGYLTDKEEEKLSPVQFNQYTALQFAINHADMDVFKALYAESPEGLEDVITGFDNDGQPLFFAGFLNLAIAKVSQMNIIQAVNQASEVISLDDQEKDYTTRFDDAWALRVDPKSTISMKAKIIMATVPDMSFEIDEATGELTPIHYVSETGFTRNLDYDTVFTQVMNLGINSMPNDFEYNLMTDSTYGLSPIIKAIRGRLTEVKNDPNLGLAKYRQIIRQLSHVVGHKRNGVIQVHTSFNGVTKVFQGAKSHITGQIISNWESQFLAHIDKQGYIETNYEWDAEHKFTKPVFKLATDFAAEFKTEAAKIFNDKNNYSKGGNRLNFQAYVKLANLLHSKLGIVLVEGDFDRDNKKKGLSTAKVLEQLRLNSIKPTRSSMRDKNNLNHYINKGLPKSFEDLFTVSIANHIAGSIASSVKDGTYNPDTPFNKSGTALEMLAKIFQAHQFSITNPQARDIKGKNQYSYILASMINHEIQNLQDVDHLEALSKLPMGKDDYFLNQLFPLNVRTGEREWDEIRAATLGWSDMTADLVNGMKLKAKRDLFEAREMGSGPIDIMSMYLFQDGEGIGTNRAPGWFYSPFGDSSAAHVVKFKKFAFAFEYTDGAFTLSKGGPHSGYSVLYSQFKNELNRIKAAFEVFDAVNNDSSLTLEQKKSKLDNYRHYIERDGVLYPGADMRMLYFGENAYNVTDDSAIYNVSTDEDGNTFPTGLKDELFIDRDIDNTIAEAIFSDIINPLLTQVVTTKINQILPYIDSLMPKTDASFDAETGLWDRASFRNIFDQKYIKNLKELFGRTSKIDGVVIKDLYKADQAESQTDAHNDEYRKALLMAMIIDQQVNHIIFANNFYQKTVDLAAFDTKGDYKAFLRNATFRLKMFGTPMDRSADNSNINVIAYNDISYGHTQIKRDSVELTAQDKEALEFVKENVKGDYINDEVIPAAYKEITALYHAHTVLAKTPKGELTTILSNYLKSSLTDGGTLKTVREYLFQQVVAGTITETEFAEQYNILMDPDSKVQMDSKGNYIYRLKVDKMVTAGTMITAERKAVVYKKDSEMVVTPAMLKNDSRLKPIFDAIHAKEDKSPVPSPGYQLAPMSAMKISNAKPIDLFDREGKAIPGTIEAAEVYSYPRNISGMQVANPDKNGSDITVGSQLQKYLFSDMHEDYIIAPDRFSANGGFTQEELNEAREELGVPTRLSLNLLSQADSTVLAGTPKIRAVPPSGLRKQEAMEAMNSALQEMGIRRLQDYVNKNGLDYTVTEAYKSAYRELGYESYEDFDRDLKKGMASDDPNIRAKSSHLYYRKTELVMRNVAKMLNDIKQQAQAKKGIDESQLTVLDHIVTAYTGSNALQSLKLALTFTPGNKQYQQVLLAEMEALVSGVDMNGFSGVQASAFMHGKVGGDLGLKGYGLQYDDKGKVIGFDSAEIAVPWVFKDKNGKPLDYDEYVNSDGTPKKHMFDEEMLNIISYRIPNTGLNMAGRYKIAKFLHPSYGDAVLVPNIIFSQMGSDLDFDKLYNYLYNYEIAPVIVQSKKNNEMTVRRIRKIKGVLHMRQNDIMDVLDTPQGIRNLTIHLLNSNDPGFSQMSRRLDKAYAALRNRIQEANDIAVDESEESPKLTKSQKKAAAAGGETIGSLQDIKDMQDLFNVNKAQDTPEAEEIKKQFADLIAQYEAKEAYIRKYTVDQKLDMKKELKQFERGKTLNYLHAQSYEQLQNAVQDLYHYILGDMNSLPAMLTPLTTARALAPIVKKDDTGLSYADKMDSHNNVINSEAYQTENRAKQAAAGDNIGNLAHSGTIIYQFQTANMSIGRKLIYKGDETEEQLIAMEKAPIVFLNNFGAVPEETGNEEGRFTGPEYVPVGYKNLPMVLRGEDKVYNIPRKLNRVGAGKHIQSLLQAFLDSTKNPEVFHSNVNGVTSNALIVFSALGYEEEGAAILKQPIIKRLVKAIENDRTAIFRGNGVRALIEETLSKAGIPATLPVDKPVAETLRTILMDPASNLGGPEFGGNRLFKLSDLEGMIEADIKGERDSNFYLDQLFALDMFNRANETGNEALSTSLKANIESAGLKNRTLLGTREQIRDYSNLASQTVYNEPTLIGSERVGQYNAKFNTSPAPVVHRQAFDVFKQSFNWLYGNHNLFADFQPSFEVMRNIINVATRRQSLAQQEKANLNILQYYLSNPALYKDFINVIPQEFQGTMSDIRRAVLNGVTYTEGKSKVRFTSLARRIVDMAAAIDPETKKAYGNIYPVLNRLRTSIKQHGSDPSWVYTINANNFGQNASAELPHNVAMMLNDSNPDIQNIAKMMFLYYYSMGGITTPQSFGHMLPQEELFRKDGFADTMNTFQTDMNHKMDQLAAAANNISKLDPSYDKPYWFRYFDPAVVGTQHIEASENAYNMYVQFIQHNPYFTMEGDFLSDADVMGKKVNEEEMQPDFTEIEGSNVVRLTAAKIEKEQFKDNMPASFRDRYQNVYVINRDYETYTRYGRLGTEIVSEYSYGNPIASSTMSGNQMRFETKAEAKERLDRADIDRILPAETEVTGDDGLNKETIVLDREDSAINMMNIFFKDGVAGTITKRINEVDSSVDTQELAELNALGAYLKHIIPGNTKIEAYSKRAANLKFNNQSRDGHITVGGLDSLGAYSSQNNKIDMAFGYADTSEDRLLTKKILVHEAAHAATQNVMLTLRALQGKSISIVEAARILGKTGKGSQIEIKKMMKAMENLEDLRTYLIGNKVFREAYVKNNGGEGNRQTSLATLDPVKLKNVDELISYLFNDKAFREALKATPYKTKSMFERIVDFIKELLGLEQGTAAYEAFDNVFTMLEGVKNSKIPAEGYLADDVTRIIEANNPETKTAMLYLRELYKGAKDFNAFIASPEELKIYDQLVKDGKIIC